MLAIFVQRGRTDAAQFAARQRRLQQVARVHRPLGFARTDQIVQLIDKQDDLSVGIGDLAHDGLQSLFKLPSKFRTGNQGTHVERDEPLVAECVRHVAFQNALGKSLHDGRLADTGIADEHWIILGAPRENLHAAPNFLVAPDDRVQLPLPRQRDQILAVPFQ